MSVKTDGSFAALVQMYGIITGDQEEALIGAFSVIVKTDGSFAALVQTGQWAVWAGSL